MQVYIENIGAHVGEEITIKGWLHNRRSSGKIHFLILRDGTGFVQAVMSKAAVGEEMFKAADHLSQETSVIVTGTARADARAPGGYEIDLKTLQIVGESHDYPITPKEHGVDYLLDRRHLWIRSERQQAILRIRHEIINAVRDFFNDRGFILADTPIFTPAACEGTTTLFPAQYFEEQTAYLTQSGQLYNEAVNRLKAKGLPIEWGGDFGGPDETALSEEFDRPVMVNRYPAAVKAFYMKPDPDRPELALGVDVLAPEGYGEIIGGGERLADLDLLLQRIKEHNLPQEAFEWYLDLRRYGTVPHGGFGMGIERVVAWVCKLEHVRETIPFPRMLYRLYP